MICRIAPTSGVSARPLEIKLEIKLQALEIKLDMTSPTVVRLSGCRLGAGGMALVVRSLGRPANAAVDTLELHSCRLGVEGALVLAAGLLANPWMLRALSVSEVW